MPDNTDRGARCLLQYDPLGRQLSHHFHQRSPKFGFRLIAAVVRLTELVQVRIDQRFHAHHQPAEMPG
jgi:hypothetical protein